jgi:acetolactate synthase-1/2/3 large subunit
MKLSDYIVSFFESCRIGCIFGFQGGSVAHLIDSISKSGSIRFIPCYHEQTAAIAAEGYARASEKFGVAVATSGPGATNMITGIANAYFDSIPVIYITGQVNTYEYKYQKPVRQLGLQETDIVSVVKPITKYAVMVDNPSQIKVELEKAVDIATSGRKGPVLLDLPMDIQRAEVVPEDLPSFTDFYRRPVCDASVLREAFSLLKQAKRPLVLCGGGTVSSHIAGKVNDFLSKTNLPYAVSLMGKGGIDETGDNFIGMIGSYGNRCANIVFSMADVVLALGSRLDPRQTGNKNNEIFKRIQFIQVDIDANELREDSIKNKYTVHADIGEFLNEGKAPLVVDKNWLKYISGVKEKYSQESDINRFLKFKDPYIALEKIRNSSGKDTVFTVDIGHNQMFAAQTLRLKPGQMFFTGGGFGSMGYALHSAIGAAFAAPEKHIVCIIGDGGFHIALQALLLISQYKLKVSVVVLNNRSLGMITQFQSLYFNSNMAGTTKAGGYEVPDIEYTAKGCKLSYYCLNNIINQEIPNDINGRVIEIQFDQLTTVVPKLEYDQPLYNMNPYLEENELKLITYPPHTQIAGILDSGICGKPPLRNVA